MAELLLNGRKYIASRLKLRQWLEFEKSQNNIHKAVEDKNIEEYARHLYILISTALNAPLDDIFNAPWFELAGAYASVTDLNRTKEIPLLKSDPSKTKGKEAPWEYDGREWFWWVHVFAKNYGWKIHDIEELDIDEAVSLLQEVLVDEQLQKEWQWSLTEIAYPYNATTKKSEFHELKRPAWMEEMQVNLPAMKVRFRKEMLPVGVIIGENGDERIAN